MVCSDMCGLSHNKNGRTNKEVFCGAPKWVEAPKMTHIQKIKGSQWDMKRRDIRAKEQRARVESNRENSLFFSLFLQNPFENGIHIEA